MPKNVGDLGKLIVAKGFEKLPKVLILRYLVTKKVGIVVTRAVLAVESLKVGMVVASFWRY